MYRLLPAPCMRLLAGRALSNNNPAEGRADTVLVTGADCHPFSAGVAADWDHVHAWRSLPPGEHDQAADPTHHQQVGTHLSAAQEVGSGQAVAAARLAVAGCVGHGLRPGTAAAFTVNSPMSFLFCVSDQCQAV